MNHGQAICVSCETVYKSSANATLFSRAVAWLKAIFGGGKQL